MTMYESNREVRSTGAEAGEFLESPDQEAVDGVRTEAADFESSQPDPVPDDDDRPVRGVNWARQVIEDTSSGASVPDAG